MVCSLSETEIKKYELGFHHYPSIILDSDALLLGNIANKVFSRGYLDENDAYDL